MPIKMHTSMNLYSCNYMIFAWVNKIYRLALKSIKHV